MYAQLSEMHQRPEPFSVYTADILWTEPHLARQMLHYHLDQSTGLASRPLPAVAKVVGWIDAKFGLAGKTLCDLGCGPGLYTERFAARGATVTGLDFSRGSIDYARNAARDLGVTIDYRLADYLKEPLPPGQDLITMIYCDLGALSPRQRQVIYRKVCRALRPGGSFLFDVMSDRAFHARNETSEYARRFMQDFWAAGDYFGFLNTLKYEAEKIVLDHYMIVEAHRTWQVFNWMQHFSPDDITAELARHGLQAVEIASDFAAEKDGDGSHVAVIAQPII